MLGLDCAYDGLDARALAFWGAELGLGLAGFSHGGSVALNLCASKISQRWRLQRTTGNRPNILVFESQLVRRQ